MSDPLYPREPGIPVIDDMIKVFGCDTGNLATPANGVAREVGHMFLAQESFFLDKTEHRSITYDCRRRIVPVAIKPQNVHHKVSLLGATWRYPRTMHGLQQGGRAGNSRRKAGRIL